jgi:predicted DCC family thiol-disulfide oxidoreductase YuxK
VTQPSTLKNTVIIYDGDCAFCQLWVERLHRALPVVPRTVPSHSVALDELGLSADDVANYAWLITPARHIAGGAILRELLIHQPRPHLRFLGHLLGLWPIPLIADGVYRLVAKNRHRLPGSQAACDSDGNA